MQAENRNVYYAAAGSPDGQNPVSGRLDAQLSSGESLTEQDITRALCHPPDYVECLPATLFAGP